jgi:hypothetical protein
MITNIYNISISNEFKILRFTVDSTLDNSVSNTLSYEIPPSIKNNGIWVPTDDSVVEEPELKALINEYKHHWLDDLRQEYEKRQDAIEFRNVTQQVILSNEEIDAILNELL